MSESKTNNYVKVKIKIPNHSLEQQSSFKTQIKT